MRIRLYLDEDAIDEDAIDSEVIAGLRSSRVNVLTAKDAGMLSRDDEDALTFAAAQSRVLYSFNKGDLLRLHTSWSLAGRGHAGIVLAQQKRYSPREQIRRLLHLVQGLSAEDMRNRVEFLSRW